MKKHFAILLFSLIFIFGCTGKRPKQIEQSPSSQEISHSSPKEAPPMPPAPGQAPIAAATPNGDTEHVGLVLGGAGVSSFATIGLLKRFQEEGIVVDYIVSTGWPTLFALGYTYMKSVHDLEWFATRLQEKDFYKVGMFDPDKGYASHEKLSQLIESSFKQSGLEEGKIPVIISSTNTEPGEPEISDKGDWRVPLLKTMSVPGIYRPYPTDNDNQWISSLHGIDVDEAVKRGSKKVVAVEMYEDYFTFLKTGKKDSGDQVFRKLYLRQLTKSIASEMQNAQFKGKIVLKASPTDFSLKRTALFAGYKEGARLAKLIRK